METCGSPFTAETLNSLAWRVPAAISASLRPPFRTGWAVIYPKRSCRYRPNCAVQIGLKETRKQSFERAADTQMYATLYEEPLGKVMFRPREASPPSS